MKNICAFFLFALSIQLSAQKIPFQGRLLDGGKPFNGTATIQFSIASPTWSETKSNVTVLDGYYSVVLGATTPLPDTLFSNSREVQLNITVNGETLSPVTLYSSLLPYTGPQGIEVDTLRAYMAEAIGVDDEGKARIMTTNNGYDGLMSLTDSLGRTGNFMRTRKAGGYLQLAQQDFTDNSFKSAALMGTFGNQGSYIDLYGGNAANDGIRLLVNAYATDLTPNGPTEDGYRRGGIDIFNYYGANTHNIFSTHEGTSSTSNLNLVASQDDGTQSYSMILSSGDGLNTGGSINITDQTGSGSISLNGTTGTINARQILINGSPIEGSSGGNINPDSVKSKSVQVLGNNGKVKSDLNFFEQNNSGSLVLYGANDSTKVILGSTGGYGGFLGLYDSLRNIGAQLRVTNKGVGSLFTNNAAHNNVGWFGGNGNDGFAQVVSFDETEAFTGAALIGSFADGSLPEYYLEGSAQQNFGLGRFRVTPLGNSTEETSRLEINRSNGGGQAVMTIAQDDGGSDPTGSSGNIDLWGDGSINVQIGSQGFEDHDLANINMYGSIDNGGGWWYNTAQFATARTGDGTQEFGNVNLYNNATGSNLQTVTLTANLNETGAGGMELFDNSGALRIIMDGNTGTIDAQQILIQGVPISASGGGNITPDTITTNYITALNDAGNEGVYLRGNTEGGSIQISSPDATNSFNRATFFAGTSANGENSFANLYGMNPTSDGNTLLINNYNTINSVFSTPFSNGYRRAGTDYYDNEGTFLAGIGSNRDESGGDPTGKSGLMIINGTNTRNAYVSGKWWDNADLGIVQVFGQNDNGAGDFSSNVNIEAMDQAGASSGQLNMNNTVNGGSVVETVLLGSSNGSGGGFLDLRDGAGNGTISLDGQAGNITANGDVFGNTLTSVDGMVQTSDRRLKKNINDLENSLSNTLKLRGVSYQWKDEKMSQRDQVGVIAQEVEAIYPEFVHTDEKGMKAVNYAQMTAVLIEAIKELNAKVETLENENSSLKSSLAEIETLRKDMNKLMEILGSGKAAGK